MASIALKRPERNRRRSTLGVAVLERATQSAQIRFGASACTFSSMPFAPAGVSLNAIEAEALATPVDMPRLSGAAPTGLTAEARAEVR